MAKFYDVVGYSIPIETKPGLFKEQIVERIYYGDVLQNMSLWNSSSESVNDDLNINNRISILADPYAYENYSRIKYVQYLGTKWKVKTVNPQSPRIILTLGGVYNG